MRKKYRRKNSTKIYIVVGFLLLYVAGMALTTFLVKEQSYGDDSIFAWQNPDYEGSELHSYSFKEDVTKYMYFPYAEHGEKYWEIWKNDTRLHDYFVGTDSGMSVLSLYHYGNEFI